MEWNMAEWIGENIQDVLGFPDKLIRGQSLALIGPLHSLLMHARCYPFNLPKKCFHSFNPQVGCTLITFMIIPGTYSVHISTYYVQTRYALSTYH